MEEKAAKSNSEIKSQANLSTLSSVKSLDSSDESTLDFEKVFYLFKKHYVIIFLVLFMVFGFWLRSYHMDYPVIGYHNMKENQYIPYTMFMDEADEFWDYFRTETYWIGNQEYGYFTQYEFPLIPWIILFFWKIFGQQLWIARLVVILFSVGSIPLLYLVGRKLTDNKALLLVACFFFSFMPLAVFFGRNVQPEAPGLFFVLLCWYFFFLWRNEVIEGVFRWKYFVFSTVALLVAVMLKVPNGIGLIPLLFFVPYGKLFASKEMRRKVLAFILVFICIFAAFPLWVTFSKWVMPNAATVGTSGFTESFRAVWHNTLRTFTASYWEGAYPALRSFALDNFTKWFLLLFALGTFFGFMKWKSRLGLFLVANTVAVFLYVLAFADKVRGHAYYQYIFLPFVCLAAAYVFFVIGRIFFLLFKKYLGTYIEKYNEKYKKIHLVELLQQALPLVLVFVFMLFVWPSVTMATDTVFDVLFYGEDVVGEFIKQESDPTERVFIDGVSSQSVGILTHAQRYGIHDVPADLSYLIELEETLNFRWVVLYGPGFNVVQTKTEVWEYLQNTYKIRYIGMFLENGEAVPFAFILEKGGSFTVDISPFPNAVPYLAATYENSNGPVEFYAIDDLH